MTTRLRLAMAAVFIAAAGAASAADPSGVYVRDSGSSKIRIARCGEGFCGTLVYLRDPGGPAKVGQRVFYNMIAAGENEWRGSAINPEDGKTYSGKMTLSGSTLVTAGCALGGLVCRSVSWVRE